MKQFKDNIVGTSFSMMVYTSKNIVSVESKYITCHFVSCNYFRIYRTTQCMSSNNEDS